MRDAQLGERRRPTDEEIDAETTPDALAAKAQQALAQWNAHGVACGDDVLNGLLEAEGSDDGHES